MIRIQEIEELRDRIQIPETREYMDEVLSNFYTGSYRSAIILLYITVLRDIYCKLESLRDLYNDHQAEEILDKIDKKLVTSPKNSEWEVNLVDQSNQGEKLVSDTAREHIESLRKERNICAHPVKGLGDSLYRPSRDVVKAFIVMMLDEVLARPPFLTDRFADRLSDHIEENRLNGLSVEDSTALVTRKYLDHITDPTVQYLIFKYLWKLAFFLDDERSILNCKYTSAVLCKMYSQSIEPMVEKEISCFSDKLNLNNKTRLMLLVYFFNQHRGMFDKFPDEMKNTITRKVQLCKEIHRIAFFYESIDEKIKSLLLECRDDVTNAEYILRMISEVKGRNEAIDFATELFSRAPSFFVSGEYFANFVRPMIQSMDKTQLDKLLQVMDNNSQIYKNFELSQYIDTIKEQYGNLNAVLDLNPYKNILHNIS